MTSRYIRPELLDPEIREESIANGVIPPRFKEMAYKGVDSADDEIGS
jgi:hypothetical protein